MKNVKKIHFVGIKGVGVAPLAVIAKQAGFEVTGSDVSEKFITDQELNELNIKIYEGFSKEHVSGVDLVIATGAHGGRDNIEVQEALDKGISVLTQGDALGIFQSGEIFDRDQYGVSVAGSHGKTTTTAMIACILKDAGFDPSYAIGTGQIPFLGSSGHFGKGKYFVVEADEYVADVVHDKTPKLLFQNPNLILLTNVDFDHPDVYKSVDEIREVFLQFCKRLPENGTLIVCGDGTENRKFISFLSRPKITYGMSPDNDYVIENLDFDSEKMFFWVKANGTSLSQFSLSVFGEQNAVNALGAIVSCLELGLSIDQIKKGLSKFSGTKRRSELIGKMKSGAILYDDYAHHPEEIKKTLQAFRKSFPNHKLITVFQPHMYSRTKTLFNDFVLAFDNSDEVIISEIFPSFREEVDPSFSSKLLTDELKNRGKNSHYSPNLEDVIKYLTSQKLNEKTVVITMGAGDVYTIGGELLNG